jgi:hypothetical protein
MANPLIQIGEVVREMTDEEYQNYLVITSEPKPTIEPK